ncbi:hypothetical protein EGW08_021234, partial [Elysia chlorotica]
ERTFLSGLLVKEHPDVHTWHIGGKKIRREWVWISMVHRQNRSRGTRRHKAAKKNGVRFVMKTEPITNNFWYPGTCGRIQYQPPESTSTGQAVHKIWNGRSAAPHGKHPWLAGVKVLADRGNYSDGEENSRTREQSDLPRDGSERFVYDGAPMCAATIISEFWLLSVAHCYWNKTKEKLRIVVADNQLKVKDAGEEIYEIEEIVPHENHEQGRRSTHDIALLKVKPRGGRGIAFNRYVQPVCLPTPAMHHPDGELCWVAGWGFTEHRG